MKHFIKSNRIALAITLIFLVFVYLAFNVTLRTQIYTIQSKKLSSSVRLALVTDLHGCYYGKNQKLLINAINKQNPDAILLGGDIFDDVQPDTHTVKFLEEIAGKYPIYYVTGNHEFYREDVDSVFQQMKALNIDVLQGESRSLKVKNQPIFIHGIDDPTGSWFYNEPHRFTQQLESVSQTLNPEAFNLLIAHRPSYVHQYLKYGFDLVTSGHAHGGQWRIPLLLNGLLAPDEGLFPKLAGGHFTFDDDHLVVSRGLALESTRVPRIFNRPELIIIELKPQKPTP